MDIFPESMRVHWVWLSLREDKVDHRVGLVDFVPIGTSISAGDSICFVHANTQEHVERAHESVLQAVEISAEVASPVEPLIERIA